MAFGSGMAAISSLCLAFGRGGIICLGEIYGGTTVFLQQQAALLGIETRFITSDDDTAFESALEQGASLVFMETPANPTLKITDIEKTARVSHQHGARLAVDNTFATPVNQQPLALGADFALQSATKYLGGHSDILGGAIIARKSGRIFDRIRENISKRPLEEFETLVNRSVLETIHRSLTTQLNAMFVMVAILLFGGASIRHFIAVLFVGLLSGTYSSIFNAVPILVAWEKRAMEA